MAALFRLVKYYFIYPDIYRYINTYIQIYINTWWTMSIYVCFESHSMSSLIARSFASKLRIASQVAIGLWCNPSGRQRINVAMSSDPAGPIGPQPNSRNHSAMSLRKIGYGIFEYSNTVVEFQWNFQEMMIPISQKCVQDHYLFGPDDWLLGGCTDRNCLVLSWNQQPLSTEPRTLDVSCMHTSMQCTYISDQISIYIYTYIPLSIATSFALAKGSWAVFPYIFILYLHKLVYSIYIHICTIMYYYVLLCTIMYYSYVGTHFRGQSHS